MNTTERAILSAVRDEAAARLKGLETLFAEGKVEQTVVRAAHYALDQAEDAFWSKPNFIRIPRSHPTVVLFVRKEDYDPFLLGHR